MSDICKSTLLDVELQLASVLPLYENKKTHARVWRSMYICNCPWVNPPTALTAFCFYTIASEASYLV